MIDGNRLSKIINFVLGEYPDSCSINVKEFDVENIIDSCIEEFENDLGLCGCGTTGDTFEIIRLILESQSIREWDKRKIKLDNICNLDSEKDDNYWGLIQFVLYVLDYKGFLEHGGSVGSAWLTEKGKMFLDLLNMSKEINDRVED